MARIVAYDEDGNEVPESEWGNYELTNTPEDALAEYEASFGEKLWDAAKAVPVKAFSSLAKGGQGLVKAAADITGSDFLSDYADRGQQRISEFDRTLSEAADYEQGGGFDTASTIGGEVAAILPQLFGPGGAVAKGLSIAGQQAPSRYGRLREGGAEPVDAAQGTGEGFAVDSALNMTLLNPLLKAGAPLASRVGLGALYGGGGGAVAAPLQTAIEQSTLEQPVTNEALLESAKTGLITGTTLGAASGVVGGVVSGSKPKLIKTQPVDLAKPLQAESPNVAQAIADANVKTDTPEVKPAVEAVNPLAKLLNTHKKQVDWARMYLVMNPLREAEIPAHSGKAPSMTEGIKPEAWAEAWASLGDEIRVEGADGTVKTLGDYQSSNIPAKSPLEAELATKMADAPTKAKELTYTAKGLDELVEVIQPGKESPEVLTPGEKTLAGQYIRGMVDSQTLGEINKKFIYPRTLAAKDPRFEPVYKGAKEYLANVHRVSGELESTLRPYLDADPVSKEKINALLLSARHEAHAGKPVLTDDITLTQMGLTPDDISKFRAVRTGMDQALDTWADALKTKAQVLIKDPAELASHSKAVDDAIAEMKQKQYVPFTRYGNKFISVLDDAGDIVEFRTYESNREWNKARKEYVKAGNNIETGTLRKSNAVGYDFMPVDFLAFLQKRLETASPTGAAEINKVISEMIEKQDLGRFKAHFKKADLLPGYSTDVQRNIADYVQGLAYSSSALKYIPAMKEQLSKIPANSPTYAYGLKYIEDLQKPTPKLAAALNKTSAVYFLSKPMSSVVNATQSITTTAPEIWNVMGKNGLGNAATAGKVFSQSSFDALKYWTKRSSVDPEIRSVIDKAVKDGIVSEQALRELTRMKESPTGQGKFGKAVDWSIDKLLTPFKATEVWNRTLAVSAGARIGKRMGLSGDGLQKFAEDFVDTTQFDMSKANRPEIARGWGSIPLQFKSSYTGNYIRFLRDGMGEGNWRRLVASPAAMVLLGGLPAVAGVKEIIKLGENMGEDPRRALNDTLGDSTAGRVLAYGAPHALDVVNLQGSLGTGDFMPEAKSEGILKTIVGPASETFFFRPAKAKKQFDQGDYLGAARYALPELFSGPLIAAKTMKDNAWTTNRGDVLAEDPTTTELLLKSIGGQIPRVAEEQIKNRSAMLLDENLKTSNKDYNQKIAKALVDVQKGNGEMGDVEALFAEIQEYNANNIDTPEKLITVDDNTIREYMNLMLSAETRKAQQLKNTAKKGRGEMAEILGLIP